ncbi:hypothetical protein, partial [Herminiimonas sp. KBW02]|uniref:hypothetical protein n=1 Tax=Herminiimonas sp. KBW02 TaxID=2153363 RepID=UPI001F2CB3B9
GTRAAGNDSCGRLLLLTFLGEARKVSSRRATPRQTKADRRKNRIGNQNTKRNQPTNKKCRLVKNQAAF